MASTVKYIFAHHSNGALKGISEFGDYGLIGAPAGLKFRVSPFGLIVYFVYRADGGSLGTLTTHVDDVLGSGQPGVLRVARKFPERRFGNLEVEGKTFVHVGMELTQATDISAPWARESSRMQTPRPPRSFGRHDNAPHRSREFGWINVGWGVALDGRGVAT